MSDLIGADNVEEESSVRIVSASKRRSKRKRSNSQSDDSDAPQRLHWLPSQTILLRGSLIVGQILNVIGICWAMVTSSPLLIITVGGFVILTLIGRPFLFDYYSRRTIREEIASYGGTVNRIQWRPFQGSFFSTGWTRRRRGVHFYDVTYTDRDAQRRSGLCAVSLWGTRWDDDIDNSFGWGQPGDNRLRPLIVKSVLLLVLAGWFVSIDAPYWIYGESTSATVTNVHRYEKPKRSRRGHQTSQTRLTIKYTFKSKDGIQHEGTSDNEITAFHIAPREGSTVSIQYIPGNSPSSRLVSSTYSPLYLLALLAAVVAIPFVLIKLLDYFDVFHLHGKRRNTRA